jgi:hypothetical protein
MNKKFNFPLKEKEFSYSFSLSIGGLYIEDFFSHSSKLFSISSEDIR